MGQSRRPSVQTYPNGMQILYDYYDAGGDFLLKQIKNISAGPNPTVISQFDYTHQVDGAIDTWTVDQGAGATTWSFGYDGSRQLTSAIRRDATHGILESNAYGYDKSGNRVQVGNGTTTPNNYGVNGLNQLLSARDDGPTTFKGIVNEPVTVSVNGLPAKVISTDGGVPFNFEALINLDSGANTIVVEATDGRNNTSTQSYSVTTAGTTKSFEYDGNGNLRFEKQPDGIVTNEFQWDQRNRLVKVIVGTHESDYEYDGESRRFRITQNESGVETSQEVFVWCGARICQKRSGAAVERNYFEQGFKETATDDYFYTRDHLGSVRDVVQSNGITIGSRLTYDPWGKVSETGSDLSDFAFTGDLYDRASSLSLTQYREYDASTGRWLSQDTIGFGGGMNVYAYVSNNPVILVDRLGLFSICDIPVLGLAVCGFDGRIYPGCEQCEDA